MPWPPASPSPLSDVTPLRIDREALRANYTQLADALGTDAAPGVVRPRVSVRLREDVTSESAFEQYGIGFTFYSDEAIERGGKGRHPSPMRYFLSGVAFCQAGWYAKGSAVLDVALDDLEISLETLLDMRGEHAVDDVPPYPQRLVLTATLESRASRSDVLAMVDWANARCPLFVLVGRAVPIGERIVLNGEIIRDSVPTDW